MVTIRLLIILLMRYEFQDGKRTAGNSAFVASGGISLLLKIFFKIKFYSTNEIRPHHPPPAQMRIPLWASLTNKK